MEKNNPQTKITAEDFAKDPKAAVLKWAKRTIGGGSFIAVLGFILTSSWGYLTEAQGALRDNQLETKELRVIVNNQVAANRKQWELIQQQSNLISELEAQLGILKYKIDHKGNSDVTYRLILEKIPQAVLPANKTMLQHIDTLIHPEPPTQQERATKKLEDIERKVEDIKNSRKLSPDDYRQQMQKKN
jgi:hypothetical protein